MFSKWNNIISGVLQGSALGPLLFVAYINTLPDEHESSDIFLFVDNNKLLEIFTIVPMQDVLLTPGKQSHCSVSVQINVI